MNLSEHFTLEEMIHSDYAVRNGIDNTPTPEIILNLTSVCRYVLEPLRDIVKKPIHVTSGYRCVELNKAIGGASNSQHTEGKAADIIVPPMTIDELYDYASKYCDYDQAIHEFNRWVHLSYNGKENRHEKLRATKENGRTIYTPFV